MSYHSMLTTIIIAVLTSEAVKWSLYWFCATFLQGLPS